MEFPLATFRKTFHLGMKKLSPTAGQARREQPALLRGARSIRNRGANGAMCRRARAGPREKDIRFHRLRFVPMRRESRNGNGAARSGWSARYARTAAETACHKIPGR